MHLVLEVLDLQHDKDEVIGMIAVDDHGKQYLVVSENGYGKRSSLEDYQSYKSWRKRCKDYIYYRKNR